MTALLLQVVLAAPLAANEAAESLPSVPSNEIKVNAGLAEVDRRDDALSVFGAPDGRVCVLVHEGYTVRALRSSNAGATFDPEIDIAGRGVGQDALGFVATQAPDGRIYVLAGRVADAGGMVLELIYSDDFCSSWSAPSTAIEPPALVGQWIFLTMRIACGADGLVAVSLQMELSTVWTTASSDAGETWTAPLLLVDDAIFLSDVAISPDGTIYVVYEGSQTLVPVIRRWTDLGQTYGPEIPLVDALPDDGIPINSTVRVARDGSVLVGATSMAPFFPRSR